MASEISGISHTFHEFPDNPLTDTQLAAFGVRPFGATYTRQANAHMIQERNYDLVVLVTRANGDPFPDSAAIAAVEPFILSVPQYFMSHRLLNTSTLPPMDGIIQTELTTDQFGPGIINHPYKRGSAQHWGAVFNLIVTSKHKI